MLKTHILASEITNLTDARYFAAREATWLSFQLNQIEASKVAAIQEWVDGVAIVPAFEYQEITDIQQVIQLLSSQTIQLGVFYQTDVVTALADYEIIQTLLFTPTTDWADLIGIIQQSKADYIVLDAYKENWQWHEFSSRQRSDLQEICTLKKIILGIPFQASEVNEVLAMGAYGINLKGSEEEKVGYKSFDEVDEILDMLEEDW